MPEIKLLFGSLKFISGPVNHDFEQFPITYQKPEIDIKIMYDSTR